MSEKNNLSRPIGISIALGLAAITCGILLYFDSKTETLQSEVLIAISLISVASLVIIHLKILIKGADSDFSNHKAAINKTRLRSDEDRRSTSSVNELIRKANKEETEHKHSPGEGGHPN